MVRSRSRALLAVTATVASLVLLAGCGGDDPKDAKSGEPEVTGTPTPSPTPTLSADAAAFMAKVTAGFERYQTVHMKIASDSMLNVEGDVDYGGDSPKIRMGVNMGAGEQQLILAGGAVYVRQGAGGKYSKLDTSDPTYGALLGSLGGLSPKSAVSGLGPAVTKVTEKGVRGRLTAYEVSLDGAKVEGALGSLVGSSAGPTKVTATFLLDTTGLLRQLDADVSGQTFTLTLSRWGQEVAIDAPGKAELLNP